MSSTVTLPSFTDEEILLFEKLNAAMEAIQARFLAGVGSADLAWPLVAEDDLNMSSYNITGGYQIWGYVNAGNYPTLTDALTAAGSGGVVLVPPDTTVTTAGGETFEGDGAAVIGAGPSSVLKFTGSPTDGYLLRSTTGSGLLFVDLTFDGNVEAGSSQIGLDLSGVSNVTISRVNFKNFSGAALKIGTSCNGVKVSDCAFDGGTEEHIYVTESGALTIANCTSDDAGSIGIRLAATGASSTIQATLTNVVITDAANYGIHALGYGSIGVASPVSLHATGCVVDGASITHAVEAGSSAAVLNSFTWMGGRINGPAAGGMLVNANGGSVVGVEINGPGTFCIDMDTSQYVNVSDCVLRDGTIGVDCGDTTAECRVHNNLIEGCTTNVVLGGVGLVQYGNGEQVGMPTTLAYANMVAVTGATSAAVNACTVTFSADTLRVGDLLAFRTTVSHNGGVSGGSTVVRMDTKTIATVAFTNGNVQHMAGDLQVTNSTTAKSLYFGVVEDETVADSAGTYSITGLDLSTDIEMDVRVVPASGNTGTVQGLVVLLNHAEV